MATFQKRGDKWFAQIRRKGHKSISKSFPTKTLATEWARKIESQIDANDFKDGRTLSKITLANLIDDYTRDVGGAKGFGKNKKSVLAMLKVSLGNLTLSQITGERLTQHVKDRSATAGGVTIAIDLTYLGAVFGAARQLWGIEVNMDAIARARESMPYLGLSTRSNERTRRPTDDEIKRLCAYYAKKKRQKVPMVDIILFAIETAMRISEIARIRWCDINHVDRTIIIRDRKHPTEKEGNDTEVPLLGLAYDIILAQPKTDERIFPINDSTPSSIFPRACQALDIADLHFHDFRHEGVSRLFEQKYGIEEVALVSGHRDWKMLARYTQIGAKNLHRAITPERLPVKLLAQPQALPLNT
ncbi:MAG: site-specific integrase [Burkholderiaceae bacterium]|nr:site-specific integrase [Burkholderiaceae bacterium]